MLYVGIAVFRTKKCVRGGEIRPGWRSSPQHHFEKVTETQKAPAFLLEP